MIGDENKYDTEFWRIRSPLEKIDRITAPTFVVGGLNDIFQRGEPLIYEGLKDHTDAKLPIGPWSTCRAPPLRAAADGAGIGNIRLAWFDHYLKGIDTGANQLPPVTQYYTGPNAMSPRKTGRTHRHAPKPSTCTVSLRLLSLAPRPASPHRRQPHQPAADPA